MDGMEQNNNTNGLSEEEINGFVHLGCFVILWGIFFWIFAPFVVIWIVGSMTGIIIECSLFNWFLAFVLLFIMNVGKILTSLFVLR